MSPISAPAIDPTALAACPDDGHLSHAAGSDLRVSRADGLYGLLDMYALEDGGQTRYITADELAMLQQGQCSAGGGDAGVVRTNNHRELLRQSIEQVRGECVTNAWLDRTAAAIDRSPGFDGLATGTDARVKQDYAARVAAFGVTTVKLEGFKPPGWEAAAGDPAACFRLACEGAQATASKGDSVTGGGGVVLYEKTAQRIQTDGNASRVAVDQIKAHIDAGRAVVAGVNEPATSSVVDAKRQPVTDHFVAVYGYEADAQGKVTALLAKDNAVGGTAEVRFEIGADGAITKPAEPTRRDAYLQQEYQMSEVRFHTSMPYGGGVAPTNDAGQRMVW